MPGPWDKYAQGVQIKPADPTLPYKQNEAMYGSQAAQYAPAQAQATAAKTGVDARIAEQTAPYDIRMSAANATKAEADAIEAQAKIAKLRAAAQGDPLGKAKSELSGIISQIDAIGEDAADNGGWFETGMTGAMLRNRPGTAAYDLQKSVSTIDANNAFRTLQEMRTNSPTGGALGSISEGELELLKSTVSNLDPNQSQGAFQGNLGKAREHYARLLGEIGGEVPTAPANETLTTKEGLYRDPALAGVEQTYRRMLAQGKSAQELGAYLGKAGIGFDPNEVSAQVKYRRDNPQVPLSKYDTSRLGMRRREGAGFVGNMVSEGPLAPLGAYGVAAGNMLTAGRLDELSAAMGGNQEQAQQVKDVMAQRQPGATLLGDIMGSGIGMTGLSAGLRAAGGGAAALATRGGGIGADTLYGALYGSGESNDARLEGGLYGALGAGAGSLLGRGIMAGAGGVARGVKNDTVRRLTSDGTTLSLGQTLGNRGAIGRTINQMESAPVIQGMSANVRSQGWKDINRQAFKEALEPYGAQATDEIGNQGIEKAHEAVGGLYGKAFGGKAMRGDPILRQDLEAIDASAQQLPEPLRNQFNAMVNLRVKPLFDGGALDGKGLQAALKGIRTDAGAMLRRSEPMADLFKDHAEGLAGALEGLAERQFPGTKGAIRNANTANRHVAVLEDAVLAAQGQGGVPTAAQIARAAINNTKKFGGKRMAAEGRVPFKDLTDRATEVMGSTHPDSGTATRVLAPLVPYALGGAAGGSEALDLPTPVAGTLGLLALLSTKQGARAFQSLATKRPDSLLKMGDFLHDKRRLGGLLGGSALLPSALNQ